MESLIKNSKIVTSLENKKVFAVIRAKSLSKALDISNALIDGGIKVIELCMNCDYDAAEAIKVLSGTSGITVAAGSVVTAEQANRALDAGATFIASPVLENRIIKQCKWRKVPVIMGASTPTEIYNAWKLGVDIIKVYPAEPLGGPLYIRNILTPMPFLRLMPTGGVNIDNFIEYLEAGAAAVGLGHTFYGEESDLKVITKKAEIVAKQLDEYLKNQNKA
ncbi:MAG: bifunctional 4-hydroxy-2-oxoglutarate aldolase/2-dehydro-3-deoxy-phosphogluconate aldolase [bacterium]